jgi:hypothetical protein
VSALSALQLDRTALSQSHISYILFCNV